jgi:ABC-type antimicrobial peptide transport system permease subunit
VAAGAAGGLAASKLVARVLYRVDPPDPTSFSTPLIALLVASVVSAAIPVVRATRIDPTRALRCD